MVNVSECKFEPQPQSITVILILVFLVGFGLNIFSLWVFCRRIRHWNSGTILQFNLALSDALGTPGSILVAVSFFTSLPFGKFFCTVKIIVLSLHFYGSIFFLMLISIHRYVAVVHFNRHNFMKQKSFVKKLCGCMWTILLAKGVIFAILLPQTTEDDHTQCLSIHQGNLTHAHRYFIINFVLFIVGFLLPFSVSAVCYGLLASSVSQINTSTAHGPAVRTKSLRMIAVCLLIFGLCFLPLNVTRTIGVVLRIYYPCKCDVLDRVEVAYYICWIFAGVNCSLDPLIYFFGSHNFRTVIRRSLKLLKGQKDTENKNESETISHTGRRNIKAVNNETTL